MSMMKINIEAFEKSLDEKDSDMKYLEISGLIGYLEKSMKFYRDYVAVMKDLVAYDSLKETLEYLHENKALAPEQKEETEGMLEFLLVNEEFLNRFD